MAAELPISAWLTFADHDAAQSAKHIQASLESSQVSAREGDPGVSAVPGLLCFTALTPALCDLLRTVSRDGIERVLAVALSRAALAGVGAWQLLQAGASDVFVWDETTDPIDAIRAKLKRWQAVDDILWSPVVRNSLVGQSPAWISVLRQIVEVAHFNQDVSVLITGETGTGKELVAQLIHRLDARPEKRDLVVLDCTTIVPELSGSEFFGHERGAFTGAVAARDGAFALADGGTLFLDEVGELPLTLQAQLLRVIQEKTYKRVGSNTWRHTEFRLVCATNRDLLHEEAHHHFRRDLYYRIASWTCKLPPLRERAEDIISLARYFVQEYAREHRPGTEPPDLDESVREYLLTRAFPGNVRDLKQLVSRFMVRHVGPGPITLGDIPEEERPTAGLLPEDWRNAEFERLIRSALASGAGLKEIGSAAENTAVRLAIDDAQGNLQRAADKLGVTDRALQMRRASRRAQAPDRPNGE
jgi:transcriptional regulator with GAF, ATPase, and Fis domain